MVMILTWKKDGEVPIDEHNLIRWSETTLVEKRALKGQEPDI
jgi:hypothetical protein